MAKTAGRLVVTAIRGRDGGSANPLSGPKGLARECFNVELDGTTLGTKKNGRALVTPLNSFPGGGQPEILLLHSRANRSDVVLYGIDWIGGTNTIARLPISTLTWSSAFTLSDNPGGSPISACGVPFHDKYFLAYDTAVDRLHVIDGNGTVVRRAGIAPPAAAPTVANTGSGSYAAVARWYQQSFRNISGSTVLAESERSPSSTSFTPSGTGTHARITKAATPSGETVTHWVVWGSESGTDGPFYEVAEVAIASSTYDDNAAPADYDNGTAAQPEGTFAVPTSARYILNDGGNRLLLAGAYEGAFLSRVWFTAALGSLGRGDDERVPNTQDLKYFIDIEEDNGGKITGFGGPLNGYPIIFKESQIWSLMPTGDPDAPYIPRNITRAVGCINHRTIRSGVDETGAPCLYFAAIDGPYRLSIGGGLQYLGRDVEDLWNVRQSATAFGEFYPKRRQYCLNFIGVETSYNLRFNALLGAPDGAGQIRGGWVRDTDEAEVTLMAAPSADGSAPGTLYSQIGTSLFREDASSVGDQNFQAYVETQPSAPVGLGTRVRTGAPVVIGRSGASTPTLTVRQIQNYGDDSGKPARDATAALSTARTHLKCENGGGSNDGDVVAFRVGDGSAQSSTWSLDALIVPWESDGDLVTM